MAKRFIDTGMFDDPWFMDLTPELKCFWMYCLTKCDHAGVLSLNKTLARIQIGCDNVDTLLLKIGDRLVLVGENKFFIPKFIDFQYGKLNPGNRVHKSVLDSLERLENKHLISPLQGAMDKAMDKDKVKYKEKDIKDIDVVFEEFKVSVKSGEQSTWVESVYMNLKLKQGSLTALVNQFVSHLKIKNNAPQSIDEFKDYFYNWLNKLEQLGKLSEHKHKAIGAL